MDNGLFYYATLLLKIPSLPEASIKNRANYFMGRFMHTYSNNIHGIGETKSQTGTRCYLSKNKSSLKNLFRNMNSQINYLEVENKFFCIKNILIQTLEVQKPET